ncbi:t-SNARE [Neocallimastix californiae]|jgi:syntaxin 5|uniref:t-SNARE n=1 Tax=Neocallimastix californiae TaxID=1754190 RepID=A0A1Y2BHX6_9FUNG|nr:t-SNARE [Neocallimastix californiae]|eukprot:ORY34394.1 t-SNARE [Neocallimastix californiae]
MPSDRTKEFQATVESILNRKTVIEQQHLLQNQTSPRSQRSEFAHAASIIGKEINSTVAKLQRLTQLAKRRTMFDDNPTEINDLIQVVKQDISRINQRIDYLQVNARNRNNNKKNNEEDNAQAMEHSKNVIVSLQSKLANTSNDFKNVLEIRTQNMREQKSRQDQYGVSNLSTLTTPNLDLLKKNPLPLYQSAMATAASLNMTSPLIHSSTLDNPNNTSNNLNIMNTLNNNNNNSNNSNPSNPSTSSGGLGFNSALNRNTATNSNSLYGSPYDGNIPMYAPLDDPSKKKDTGKNPDTFISINMIDDSQPPNGSLGLGNIIGGEQQQLLANPVHTEYLESRSQAIDSIESTIAELGQIYQHFAQILAGQRETVQRIDDNIADVEMNVEGAQTQLMKYYNNISNNRWLILKALGIVLIFFLIFVMFL